MASIDIDSVYFNHEIPFCKVYSLESKDKLQKLLLSNRISFFVEWQENRIWSRLFSHRNSEKNVFTIRINEADSLLAKDLVEGIDSVQLGIL